MASNPVIIRALARASVLLDLQDEINDAIALGKTPNVDAMIEEQASYWLGVAYGEADRLRKPSTAGQQSVPGSDGDR